MDPVKVGSFLRALRKEKNMTQEKIAERLNVSSRTISRWETGTNMPDIDMLVEIADYYEVSIPEIIHGERKSETMNEETRETAAAMAEYSQNEVKKGKTKIIGVFLSVFGVFIILSALMVFPGESSWGSIYSVLGSIFLVPGIYLLTRPLITGRGVRILTVIGCILLLFGFFSVTDYLAVKELHQVPRFRYETVYESGHPDRLIYKTLFFNAVRENPGTSGERVYLLKK